MLVTKFTKSNMRIHYYVLDERSKYKLDISYHVTVNITDKYFAMVKGQERRIRGQAIALAEKEEASRRQSKRNKRNIRNRWDGIYSLE